MEKKVESPKTSTTQKISNNYDGKELVRLFQNMSVKTSSSDILWRNCGNDSKPKMHKVQPCLKFKKRVKKKTPASTHALPLRPSKLKPKTESGTESRFSDFSAACSRELDTIAAKPDEDKSENCNKSQNKKKRKASASCAQQARNECLTSSDSVNISIDYLTDYLEETILFPKKMSYMAELMYT